MFFSTLFAKNKKNEVYCWGKNNENILTTIHDEPFIIPLLFDFEFPSPIIKIFSTPINSFVICEDNSVYLWGKNYLKSSSTITENFVHKKLDFIFESPIKQVCVGDSFIFFLCENEKLFCYGSNNAVLSSVNIYDMKKPIEFHYHFNGSTIKKIFCGSDNIFVICENEKLLNQYQQSIYCWGSNKLYKLGLGMNIPTFTFIPCLLSSIENSGNPFNFDSPIENIICLKTQTFFISQKNSIYVCGFNNSLTFFPNEKIPSSLNPYPLKLEFDFDSPLKSFLSYRKLYLRYSQKW